MPALTIVTRAGEEFPIQGETDTSLMETIRNAGIDELLALCGAVAPARPAMSTSTQVSMRPCNLCRRTRTT